MQGDPLASLAFCVFALAVILLPFLPVLFEVFRHEDATPSDIPATLLADPRNDAQQALWYHAYRLQASSLEHLSEIARAAETRSDPSGTLLLKAGAELPERARESHILTYGPLHSPPGRRVSSKILSMTSAEMGEGGEFLEIHCRQSLRLGPRSRVLWWASAERVEVGQGSTLIGKVNAVRGIQLADRIRFHLLEAPTIEIAPAPERPALELDDPAIWVRPPASRAPRREVILGDLEIPEGTRVEQDLIVRGRLTVGRGAVLLGSVKSQGELSLRSGARVRGSVFARHSIRMGAGVEVRGAVASEERIEIGARARIGLPEAMVTVIGSSIVIRGSSRIHGTLRAWRGGEVRLTDPRA